MQKVLFLVILFSQGLGSLAQDQNQLEGRVEVKVEQVNTLRETLVSGVSERNLLAVICQNQKVLV
jgi:hypothetical protein